MKLFSSRKVIAILLLVVAVGLFANLMVYWVLPVVKAQSACTIGEQVIAIPLSAGGSPGAMPGVGFPGIHGGWWTIYALVGGDGKLRICYYEIDSDGEIYHACNTSFMVTPVNKP